MPDRPGSPKDLGSLWSNRAPYYATVHKAMDEVLKVIEKGEFPDKYQELFSPKQQVTNLELTRSAHQHLTALSSKVFPIYVPPKGNSDTKRKEAERVEKIAYSYNSGAFMRGGADIDQIMHNLAYFSTACGDAVLVAYPDYKRKLVFFKVRDPRSHFPPLGWSPWSEAPLDNTLIAYQMTLGELKARYSDSASELDQAYNKMTTSRNVVRRSRIDDSTPLWVGEYYSTDAWYVATLEDTVVVLVASEHDDKGHPDVCPVSCMTQMSATDPKGRPVFLGQLGLEAASAKVISQEIEAAEQMLFGPIAHTPFVGGGFQWNQPNIFDPNWPGTPAMQRLAPSSPFNTERLLGSLVGLSRILNLHPESASGAGEAVSGKAIQTLNQGPRTIVQDILWVPYMTGMPRGYSAGAKMEINLWPNDRKTATGKRGKSSFETEYIPSVHLAGYEDRIKIEPGLGLGGYQAVLDYEQRYGAGLMSRRTFMEQVPDIRDAEEEIRRIESEEIEKSNSVAFEALAGVDPMTAIRANAEIKRLIDEDGISKFEAIRRVIESGLLQPPAPEAPPGVPPDLAALVGGGAPEALPPPSLAAARGF